MKKIVCYSGGKDSTAMLIHLIESDAQINDILYVDVGDWMWESAKKHNKQVEKRLGVKITCLDVTDELKKGFARWGFPSMFNRWCTGIKKEAMRQFLQNKYIKEGERESIVQYIGYCSDESKRTNGKLWATFEAEYPLVESGITTTDALQICKEYGFDFGGVYEHHHHFNCWLCPLQKREEVEYLFKHDSEKWEKLREMQFKTDGYYSNGLTIMDLEKKFWEKTHQELRKQKMEARQKYRKR